MLSNEERIRAALSVVLTNAMIYPSGVAHRVLGADMSNVIDRAVEAVVNLGLTEEADSLYAQPLVDRVEVIDETGRAYVSVGLTEVVTSLQDGGKTLNVFVGWEGS